MKEFSLKEKQDLLKSARGSIKKYLGLEDDSSSILEEGNLSLERGIFVTLHKQAGLRGCIGYIYPQGKLLSSVRKLALEAAFRDPRFLPLSREELSEVDIEISVLTVPKRVVSPYDINLGEDGVIIKKGSKQGVYLPQVAKDTGWSLEEFLGSLALSKAGLPENAWREPSTELYVFQAIVFGEKEMGLI